LSQANDRSKNLLLAKMWKASKAAEQLGKRKREKEEGWAKLTP